MKKQWDDYAKETRKRHRYGGDRASLDNKK
jgi:hypothetical protein